QPPVETGAPSIHAWTQRATSYSPASSLGRGHVRDAEYFLAAGHRLPGHVKPGSASQWLMSLIGAPPPAARVPRPLIAFAAPSIAPMPLPVFNPCSGLSAATAVVIDTARVLSTGPSQIASARATLSS